MTRIRGILPEGVYTFVNKKTRVILSRMRNVSEKSCNDKENSHLCAIIFFENLAFYVIMWKNMAEPDRPQMTV